MAIACLRLRTVLPLLPDFSCPRFISWIALFTLRWAVREYRRAIENGGNECILQDDGVSHT